MLGANGEGRLGDGTTTDRNTPTQTSSLGTGRTAIAISAGGEATCVILDDGSVSCWGGNSYGRLGDGTTTDRYTPTQTWSLGTGRTAVAISLADYHTCAILDDGSGSCWGQNNNGRLGDGTTSTQTTPVQVSGLENAIAIATGGYHTCAILDDGSVSCWGWNSDGQVGDGTNNERNTPTQVNGLENAVAIATGYAYTCAVIVSLEVAGEFYGADIYCWEIMSTDN